MLPIPTDDDKPPPMTRRGFLHLPETAEELAWDIRAAWPAAFVMLGLANVAWCWVRDVWARRGRG